MSEPSPTPVPWHVLEDAFSALGALAAARTPISVNWNDGDAALTFKGVVEQVEVGPRGLVIDFGGSDQ